MERQIHLCLTGHGREGGGAGDAGGGEIREVRPVDVILNALWGRWMALISGTTRDDTEQF